MNLVVQFAIQYDIEEYNYELARTYCSGSKYLSWKCLYQGYTGDGISYSG